MLKDSGHLMVGHADLSALVEALTAIGLGEVKYNIVNTTYYPGWGFMEAQGATTVWECRVRDFAVEGGRRRSDNMTMLAGLSEFFYPYIAGIQGPNFFGGKNLKPGYQEFRIKPYPLKDLTSTKATVQNVRGEISSSWEILNDMFNLEVQIPINMNTQIGIPKLGKVNLFITEGEKTIWSNNEYKCGDQGVIQGIDDGFFITFTVGSGNYSFKVK